jgi:hypothetical protein
MFFQTLPHDPERPTIKYMDGILEISGKCIPTDALVTFTPLICEFEFYASLKQDLTVLFKLDYMNTSSNRYWIRIIEILNEMFLNKCKVKAIWYYQEIDERIEEQGDDLRNKAKFNFKLKRI